MKRALRIAIATIAFVGGGAQAANYQGLIAELQPNHETYECFYFRLEGVTTISPASIGGWFAISRNQPGARDAYAAVLSARLAGIPIRVSTGSTSVCGHAQALYVSI